MLEWIVIASMLFAAAVFLYEKHLCSEIEKRLTRIEMLVEEMDADI